VPGNGVRAVYITKSASISIENCFRRSMDSTVSRLVPMTNIACENISLSFRSFIAVYASCALDPFLNSLSVEVESVSTPHITQ